MHIRLHWMRTIAVKIVCSCSAGGVIVKNASGNIVCSQKLDDRLSIAYSQTLPEIRATLFGAEKPVRA